ncbi:MAG: hypothetical protein Kow0037_29950 [Calditrichia bacterium]
MVIALVIISFIIFLAIDYLIRRKKTAAQTELEHPGTLSLSKILNILPSGVFLQPSFTWSKILDSGYLILGIHPLLLGLIGKPDEIELFNEGQEIAKGDPVLKISKKGRQIEIKSPIPGKIQATNPQISPESSWENLGHQWLYVIEPVNVSEEVGNWFVAEKSHSWLNEKYQEIKSFFMQSLPNSELGLTMADGGDLPVGVLSQSDKKTWQKFEKKFL